MKRHCLIIGTIFLTLLAGWAVMTFYGLFPPLTGAPEARQPLTIGLVPFEAYGLLKIAEERHYFEAQNLAVTFLEFQKDIQVFGALERGEADVGAVSDFNFAAKSFEPGAPKIIASLGHSHTQEVISRQLSGIRGFGDLRNKTVGLLRGTVAEFFLARGLILAGLTRDDVILENLERSAMAEALANGQVDSVIAFDPYAQDLKVRLSPDVSAFTDVADQGFFLLLTASDQTLRQKPDALKKLISALLEALEFTREHPDEARAVLAKSLNLNDSSAGLLWAKYAFGVEISQALLLDLEDQARWMIDAEWTDEKTTPNYLDLLAPEPLNAVDPAQIKLIR